MFLPVLQYNDSSIAKVHKKSSFLSTLSNFHFSNVEGLFRFLGRGPVCVLAKHTSRSMWYHILRTEPSLCSPSNPSQDQPRSWKDALRFCGTSGNSGLTFLQHAPRGLLALTRSFRATYSYLFSSEHISSLFFKVALTMGDSKGVYPHVSAYTSTSRLTQK